MQCIWNHDRNLVSTHLFAHSGNCMRKLGILPIIVSVIALTTPSPPAVAFMPSRTWGGFASTGLSWGFDCILVEFAFEWAQIQLVLGEWFPAENQVIENHGDLQRLNGPIKNDQIAHFWVTLLQIEVKVYFFYLIKVLANLKVTLMFTLTKTFEERI